MANLQDRIKNLRIEKDYTQQQLASLLEVSRSTVAGWETGKRKPDYETIHKLADIFAVSTDYLLGRSNIKEPAELVEKAIADDPELLEFWNKIKNNQDKKKLIQQINKVEADDEEYIRHIISTLQSLYEYKGKIKDSEKD